jgi:ring-1,2-phenylacetyl-CoA epoxidase subunit PaaD
MIINPDIVFNYLTEVFDPEVPVLDIVAMGIVRDVKVEDGKVEVTITPTYSGCPAMKVIEDDITSKLKEKGITNLQIKTILSPAWTTDWMSEEGKEKLRAYGIAPPEKATADKSVLFGKPKVVKCPRCGSEHTELKSQFGSTACKALYICKDCLEPFDYFKCI